MYILNNDFKASTLDELANKLAYYMFERDDYILAEDITQEQKVGDLVFSRNFRQDELTNFQIKADYLLDELKEEYQQEKQHQESIQSDYYSNLINYD